jgi:hypothetical protein
MRRREFTAGYGSAVAWPDVALAIGLRSMNHALLLLLASTVVICAIRPASSQDYTPA